ncbi:MAG: 3-oxoacyl-[acyl-carrier-protein] synthase 3 [Candidatus Omnitrophica bacterium]|nr:3-oxoacyl-[acyl-carrier-protein] synthase 3 [Candidatus Omnitrophota bacterium]
MSSPRSGIAGLGFAVPERVLTNRDLEKMVETTDEWIRTRTGISERRIAAPGTGTSDLGAAAAIKAISSAGLKPSDIDLIIAATTTPDMPLPSCACLIQQKIGAQQAAAFDLAAACAGFVYGLTTADSFVRSGAYRNVLVVGADQISSFIDWTDRSTCVLFGDGAGAAVVRSRSEGGILSSVIGSDGAHAELLKIAGGGSCRPASAETLESKQHFLYMSGSEVFKLAVRGMADAVSTALERSGTRMDEVTCLIPHQANQRIIDAVSERLGFPKEKVFINLDKYGNTSAASCAIALCEAVEQGRIHKGDKIVMATFGAGLVWGAMVIQW